MPQRQPPSTALSTANAMDWRVSQRVTSTLDPCVVLMKELISQYQSLWVDRGGIYSLAQGVVYWKPPLTVTQALQDELSGADNAWHLYGPDEGLQALREALQAKIQRENQLDQHDVLVTMGANQAYMNIVLTLLHHQPTTKNGGATNDERQDQGVVFAPYYFNHVMALQLAVGDDNVVVGPTTDQGWPDTEWLREQLQQQNDPTTTSPKRIRMVTVTNPNNPLGVALDKAALQPMVDLCREYGVWLVLDCTYEYFLPSLPTFGEDPHVIYIFSFSKSYAMAGYRVGYVVLPQTPIGLDRDDNDNESTATANTSTTTLLAQMLKVQDTIPIGPSRVSQAAALGALRVPVQWVKDQYETLQPGRQAIREALEAACPRVIGGTGAMYVMGQLPMLDDDDDVAVARYLVREYGVAVIPGSFCGAPGWIRVCYANLPPEDCAIAAQRLSEGLQSLLVTASKE